MTLKPIRMKAHASALEAGPSSPRRRQIFVGAAAATLLSACGGNGNDEQDTDITGAVYSATNKTGGNTIAAFRRRRDGRLEPLAEYATGGLGGVFDGTNDGLDPLIAEDEIIAVDNRFVLAVNAGSNTISSLRINDDFSLTLIGTAPTGGMGPDSIDHSNGFVYVSNSDTDGVFNGASDQIGNVTGFRLDRTSGALTPIPGSTRLLANRPSDVEFSPDGKHLIVSSWNAGSTTLANGGSNAELVVYGVQADGTLTAAPQSSAASTLRGNTAGRNLPAVIGFASVAVGARNIVIATEAREFLSNGDPAMLAQFQTGSVSTWELNADGSLTPRSLDVLTGPVVKTGTDAPTSACWITVSPDRKYFWVAHASGGVISSFSLNPDGTIALINTRAFTGMAAQVGAANPLANASGLLDLTVSSDGRYLYQLFDLKGSIYVFEIGTSASLTLLQQTSTLLPPGNSIGLVSVDRR